ncbi:MAG: SH3 domain-containing protein, partial [Firmicutes bacterium]|nr:SH3 domain-containing protein [Bacillota bacterium]
MHKQFLRWTKPVAAAVLAATMLTAPALAANTGGATVNASKLNLRSGADTSYSVLTTAPRGSTVVVEAAAENNWYKVWYKGCEGYMSGDYLSLGDSLDAPIGSGTVRGSTVRMRAEPSTGGEILGYYETGAVMDITGVYGAWYKVSCDGVTGYVHSDYMTLGVPAVPVSDPAPAADPAAGPSPSGQPAEPQPSDTPAA